MVEQKYQHPMNPENIKYSVQYGQILGLGRDEYEGRIFSYRKTFGHANLDRAQDQLKTDSNFMFGDDIVVVVGPDMDEVSSVGTNKRQFSINNLGCWLLEEYGYDKREYARLLRDIAWLEGKKNYE